MDTEVLFKILDKIDDMGKRFEGRFTDIDSKIDSLNEKHNGLKLKVATIAAGIGAIGSKFISLFIAGGK